jgi:hypothetical protein
LFAFGLNLRGGPFILRLLPIWSWSLRSRRPEVFKSTSPRSSLDCQVKQNWV